MFWLRSRSQEVAELGFEPTPEGLPDATPTGSECQNISSASPLPSVWRKVGLQTPERLLSAAPLVSDKSRELKSI